MFCTSKKSDDIFSPVFQSGIVFCWNIRRFAANSWAIFRGVRSLNLSLTLIVAKTTAQCRVVIKTRSNAHVAELRVQN